MDVSETNGHLLDSPVPVAQPVGIYGWRKRCIYAFVLVLLVVVVMNLAVSVWILRVMRFSLDGMGKLKIAPNGFQMDGEAEFTKPVYTREVRSEKELYVLSKESVKLISGVGGSNMTGNSTSRLLVAPDNIVLQSEDFTFQDSGGRNSMSVREGKIRLSSPDVEYIGNMRFGTGVYTTTVLSERDIEISSPTSQVKVTGRGGVTLEAAQGESVRLQGGGSVVVEAGLEIQLLGNLSLPSLPSPSSSTHNSSVFELCVCQNNGRLFLGIPAQGCQALPGVC